MKPPKVDVLDVIRRRAVRYLAELPPKAGGTIVLGDSRDLSAFGKQRCFDWVITSPPYYGMRTYVPDQWLRHWFLGGPEHVDYSCNNQLQHSSAQTFALELRKVWCNAAAVCTAGARLIIRFGGINDRNHDPLSLLRLSFRDTPWRCQTVRPAGTAEDGRRQCRQFGVGTEKPPRTEYDIYAALD